MIAPDLPGFGWSDKPPDRYEKEELAGRLLGLLDELGVDQVTWIGHDWGGWLGFLAALRSPERFERMLAVTIPHFWAPADRRADARRCSPTRCRSACRWSGPASPTRWSAGSSRSAAAQTG